MPDENPAGPALYLHMIFRYLTRSDDCGVVVQLVRTLACHARGRGFESRRLRHFAPSGQMRLIPTPFQIPGYGPPSR